MLSLRTLALARQNTLAPWTVAAAWAHQEGLRERIKHVADDIKHKAEDAVHKVTDAIHERREVAHEEAERGMFTADDISEAEELARRAHERHHPSNKQPPREYTPDDEEALLEEASSDVGQDYRQKELESLRRAVTEDEAQATEAVRKAAQESKRS